jgi:hypothetical protein
MSDKHQMVECRIHGQSYATFVCQHLPQGQGLGFYSADVPDDPQPDAWCGECEKVRMAEGEWNDMSQAFAKITMLCAGCYEVAKKRNRPPEGFVCGKCGQYHAELPMDFGADAPAPYYAIPEAERPTRCDLTSDLCIIDAEHFFIRGCLEIPVADGPRPFVWSVWTSLSKQNFKRAVVGNTRTRKRAAIFRLALHIAAALPRYPPSEDARSFPPLRQRPFVELEPTDHPLAVEQRHGITMDRVREIAEALLHGGEKPASGQAHVG